MTLLLHTRKFGAKNKKRYAACYDTHTATENVHSLVNYRTVRCKTFTQIFTVNHRAKVILRFAAVSSTHSEQFSFCAVSLCLPLPIVPREQISERKTVINSAICRTFPVQSFSPRDLRERAVCELASRFPKRDFCLPNAGRPRTHLVRGRRSICTFERKETE